MQGSDPGHVAPAGRRLPAVRPDMQGSDLQAASRTAAHQRVDRLLQRRVHPVLARLADERAVDQLDLGRTARLDVLEHRREVRAAAPGREHVHLPRIVVQLDARRTRNRLPLVDQRVHEAARESPARPPARSGSRAASPVSAATPFTVALKISFDHCAGRRSGSTSTFSPDRAINSPACSAARPARPRRARARSPCRGCTRPACPSASFRR